VEAGGLLAALPEVAASAGSACASLDSKPSHVLKAMGLADKSEAAIRFGLGRFTTLKEVERAAELVTQAVRDLSVPLTQS
jgi:cysteine desulfurase